MMKLAATLGLIALMPGTAMAEKPCLTPAQAESLIIAALPPLIGGLGQRCRAAGQETQALSAARTRYLPDAVANWPVARTVIMQWGDEAKMLGSVDYASAEPAVAALLAGEMIEKVQPDDCGGIGRIADSLAPMPTKNMARLVLSIVVLAQGHDDKDPIFNLCPNEAAR